MIETVKYPYSLKFSAGTILLMLLLMLLLLRNVIKANVLLTWVIFGFFAAIFVFMLGLLFVKRLVPAVKGNIAMELNEEVLIDYIRNITINWNDIRDIKLIRGRSASTIRVDLKWESDYGSQISIPLRWIKGKDADIYKVVMKYLKQAQTVQQGF